MSVVNVIESDFDGAEIADAFEDDVVAALFKSSTVHWPRQLSPATATSRLRTSMRLAPADLRRRYDGSDGCSSARQFGFGQIQLNVDETGPAVDSHVWSCRRRRLASRRRRASLVSLPPIEAPE